MFKGMYELVRKGNKKRLADSGILNAEATPILDAESLLSTEKRQQILLDIRTLLSLPDEEYNRIFLSVIHNFAEFVQNLPETARSYYSSLGGMLEHALERASLSLFLCRTYLLPDNASLDSLSEDEMLWVYAVFTAALLLDVGKIATRHIITLCDDKGSPSKAWSPYSGSMIGQATHYLYGFNEEHHDHMRHLITPLLARQILPPGEPLSSADTESHQHFGGFNWIASDPEVLESWLSLLADEHRSVGSLLTVIPLADAQLLESYFGDRKVFRHSLSPQTVAFLNKLSKDKKEYGKKLKELREKMLTEDALKTLDKTHEKEGEKKLPEKTTKQQALFGFPGKPTETKTTIPLQQTLDNTAVRDIAKRFIDWVQQGLEKGKISVNQAGSAIFSAENKVFINQQLLQNFLSENKSLMITNVNDLTGVLAKAELARPLTLNEMAQNPSLVASIQQVLVVQSPSLVFGMGAQSANITTFQANPPAQSVPPPVQTAAEQYDLQQQKQQSQSSPRPMFPGK